MRYRIAEKDKTFYPERQVDNVWYGITNDALRLNTYRMKERAAQFKSLEEARAFLGNNEQEDEIKIHPYP